MIYGRAMSKREAKELKKTHKLRDSHDGEYIPVFDSPKYILNKIHQMNNDKIKGFFRQIGIRKLKRIVLFDVPQTDNIIGPIPQTNGLREYKIPAGTLVEVIETINL